MMRAYELMVIIDGDVEDTEAQARVKSITDSITKAGGTVHGKPDWCGRRQYAYPINKKQFGYYVVYNLLAEGGALDELERSFRIADDIVRHKLIRLPDAEAARRGLAGTAA
jgi:small subunit ribosomal protein S6